LYPHLDLEPKFNLESASKQVKNCCQRKNKGGQKIVSNKGGDLLIECLKAQGVRCVFGMPGVQNLQIYDAIFRRGAGVIDHYLVRHEYAATLMAHGFARTTNDVGVALTVPGPGATNAATGILEAYTDCVPVLLITGQGHSKFYKKDPAKMFHGLDQMSFFRPITKHCAIAQSTDEIPDVVEKAFRALRSGRPGPVVLEFPDDVLAGSTTADIPPLVEREPGPSPDPDRIQGVSKPLADAGMPMILAGSAVIHAGAREELRLLAEKLNAPVAVTRCAKGAFREDHPLALNHCCRFVADEAMKVADCIIAIGTRFAALDTRHYTLELPRPLIQIDEDPREIGLEYPCEFSVVGDLKASLRALIESIDQGQNDWQQQIQGYRKRFAAQPPIPLLSEIREVLPEDGILSVDAHSIGYATHDEFPVVDPTNFLFPAISVALGYAFPAALGAKAAHPDRPVVCFAGDGGFMMGSPELSTAMKYGMNVVTIIVNDRTLSGIKGSQQKHYEGRIIDCDLHNPDFVQFANSFGAYGRRVDDLSEFKSIFEEALSLDRPSLIEVPITDRQQELIDGIEWLRSGLLRTP
jgi:acetolactate synthase-1/2/3 large subunit